MRSLEKYFFLSMSLLVHRQLVFGLSAFTTYIKKDNLYSRSGQRFFVFIVSLLLDLDFKKVGTLNGQ